MTYFLHLHTYYLDSITDSIRLDSKPGRFDLIRFVNFGLVPITTLNKRKALLGQKIEACVRACVGVYVELRPASSQREEGGKTSGRVLKVLDNFFFTPGLLL